MWIFQRFKQPLLKGFILEIDNAFTFWIFCERFRQSAAMANPFKIGIRYAQKQTAAQKPHT